VDRRLLDLTTVEVCCDGADVSENQANAAKLQVGPGRAFRR